MLKMLGVCRVERTSPKRKIGHFSPGVSLSFQYDCYFRGTQYSDPTIDTSTTYPPIFTLCMHTLFGSDLNLVLDAPR